MKFVLDTNICIHAMHSTSPILAEHLESRYFGELILSTISLAELEYGIVAAAPQDRQVRQDMLDSLLEDLVVAPFDAAAARAYGEIRRADPMRGRNALDKLIAAHALSLGAVLVTNNEMDFRRFPGLVVENWAA